MPYLALLLFLLTATIILTFSNPIYGFYILLFLTLLLEQYKMGRLALFTDRLGEFFFGNLNNFLPFYFPMNALEILLALILVASIIRKVTKPYLKENYKNVLLFPTLLFLLTIAWFEAYGLIRGGNWKVSLWEIRALIYLCILIFLIPHLISNKKEISIIIWIFIVAIGFKALQGLYRYIFLLRGDLSSVRAITAHEDALFFASMFILLLGFYLFNVSNLQRKALIALTPIMFLTFVLTNRRVCYVALILGLGFLTAIVPREKKKILAKFLISLVLVIFIYVPLFWNSSSKLAMPVQAVKSIFKPTARDIHSNLYRRYEEINLMASINENLLLGTGFGQKYRMVVSLSEIGYSLRDYIPHNEILWIWVKTGTVGFAIFWIFIGSIIIKCCNLVKKLNEGYFKAVALTTAILVIMQLVVSYADLQLTFYRNMVYMGTLIGMTLKVESLERARECNG
jgi:hypothetical protein